MCRALGLNSNRERVNVGYYAVLAEDERLVVTTVLLNKFTMGYFQALFNLRF